MATHARNRVPGIASSSGPLLMLCDKQSEYGPQVEATVRWATMNYPNYDDDDFMECVLGNLPEQVVEDPGFLPSESALVHFQTYVLAYRLGALTAHVKSSFEGS